MLHKAVKKLVIEKRNEVVERVNLEGNKKEFWAFISKRTKGRIYETKQGFLYLVQRVSCECYRGIISV